MTDIAGPFALKHSRELLTAKALRIDSCAGCTVAGQVVIIALQAKFAARYAARTVSEWSLYTAKTMLWSSRA